MPRSLYASDELEPDVVELAGHLPGGFTLSLPVLAEVWIENGEYVADVADFNLHTFGATRAEALANVCSRFLEQRARLLAMRHRLSPLNGTRG